MTLPASRQNTNGEAAASGFLPVLFLPSSAEGTSPYLTWKVSLSVVIIWLATLSRIKTCTS